MAKGLAINFSGPYPSFLLQLEVVNYSIKKIMLNLLSSIIYLSFYMCFCICDLNCISLNKLLPFQM